MRPALAAVFALLALSACGGSSTASKVAAAAKTDHGAQSAKCTQTAGAKRLVYRCDLAGVDLAHRPASSIGSDTLVRCYADDDGLISDVTAVMARGCTGLL